MSIHYPTIKALIDGVVLAGVIGDDSPAWVERVSCMATTRGPDGVRIIIIGEPQ